MKLYIKYMVSLRCKMIVKQALDQLSLPYITVELGLIEFVKPLTDDQYNHLKLILLPSGLEVLDDKRNIMIERIKNVIIEMIHYSDEPSIINYSEYISKKIGYDYTYLANMFSELKGTTIQQFIIAHKIEKAKELLLYNELNLTQISYKLHYSSVAHLSAQFKKVTGLTPTFYKNLTHNKRSLLEAM